jgi:hypothetical protein
MCLIHSFFKNIHRACILTENTNINERISNNFKLSNILDIYGSAFTNKADDVLKRATSSSSDAFFFDSLKMSEMMNVVRSCYIHGSMINMTDDWRWFLECVKYKLITYCFDVFGEESSLMDVPYMRLSVSEEEYRHESDIVESALFEYNRCKTSLPTRESIEKDDIRASVAIEHMVAHVDLRDRAIEKTSESRDANIATVDPMAIPSKTARVIDRLEGDGFNALKTNRQRQKSDTITDSDVVLFENRQADDMLVEEPEERETKNDDTMQTRTDALKIEDDDDDRSQGSSEDDDSVESGEAFACCEHFYTYAGLFANHAFGLSGALSNLKCKRLFDLNIFDQYGTKMMRRKQDIHHGLTLFLKFWGGFKLLNPSDMLKTNIRSTYLSYHVSRDDVNWYLVEGTVLDVKRRLTTDPERMLDNMYAKMSKQIKDFASKKPTLILSKLKNDPVYRGFLDWMRLYVASSCVSVGVDKFFTPECKNVLHFENWIGSKNWFEQKNFPFIYMHNGTYNVFYNGCQIYCRDVPSVFVQTVNYIVSDKFSMSQFYEDFEISEENEKYVEKVVSFWTDALTIVSEKTFDLLIRYDEIVIINMMKATFLLSNASKQFDTHCYESPDYIALFDRVLMFYYVQYHIDENVRFSSKFTKEIHRYEFDDRFANKGSEFEPTDTLYNLDFDTLNSGLSQNFGIRVSDLISGDEDEEEKCATNENTDRYATSYENLMRYMCESDARRDSRNTHEDNAKRILEGFSNPKKSKPTTSYDTCYESLATWLLLSLEYSDNPDLKKKIKSGLIESMTNLVKWYYEKSAYTNEDVIDRMTKPDIDEKLLKEDKKRAKQREMMSKYKNEELTATSEFYKNTHTNDDASRGYAKRAKHKKANRRAKSKNDPKDKIGTDVIIDFENYENDFESFKRQDIGIYYKSEETVRFLDDMSRCVTMFDDLKRWILDYDYLIK